MGPLEPTQPIGEYFAELKEHAPPPVVEAIEEFEEEEQRARFLHAGDKARTELMRFLLDDLGLTATKAADFLTASPKTQDEICRAALTKMALYKGTGDSWEIAYKEQRAHEAIPIAFHRTFLAIWGEHKQDFDRISFL
jgi:hypothetical protein